MISCLVRYSFLSLNLFVLFFVFYLKIQDPSSFFVNFLFFLTVVGFSCSLFFKNKKFSIVSSLIFIFYPIIYSLVLSNNTFSFIENIFPFTYIFSQAFLFTILNFIILLLFSSLIVFFRKNRDEKFIQKYCRYVGVTILSLVFVVLSMDLFVYWQYRFHINSSMLALFFSANSSEIFDLPSSMYIILVVFIVTIMVGMYFVLRVVDRYIDKTNKFKFISFISVMIFIILSFNLIHGVARWNFIPSVLNKVSVIPLSYPMSFNRWFRKLGFKPNSMSEVVTANTKNINSNFYYPKHQLEFDSKLKEKDLPNIIFILIDSLRFDVFNEEVMPNSFKFFKDGTYFKNHYSGGNATSTGVFSLFYSISSSYWQSATNLGVSPIFMDTLARYNYKFLIYSATSLLSPEFYRNVFLNIDNLRVNNPSVEGEHRDYIMRQEFLNYIKETNLKRPVFTFLFFDAPHSYYFPRNNKYNYTPLFTSTPNDMNYFALNNDTDRTPYINMYKNSVNYVDMLLKDVYSSLEKKGLLENSIVILSGDHAQEINDNHRNFWGHNSNFSKYQTQVPFVIKWNTYGLDNKLKQQRIVSKLSSHHDIVPTLLNRIFLCKNNISDYSQGQDLFSQDSHPLIPIASYTQKAILDNNENILIFDNYGSFKISTSSSLEELSINTVPSKEIKEGLLIFSSFYNKN